MSMTKPWAYKTELLALVDSGHCEPDSSSGTQQYFKVTRYWSAILCPKATTSPIHPRNVNLCLCSRDSLLPRGKARRAPDTMMLEASLANSTFATPARGLVDLPASLRELECVLMDAYAGP